METKTTNVITLDNITKIAQAQSGETQVVDCGPGSRERCVSWSDYRGVIIRIRWE
ncbi:hypothetical protein LX69_02679 [Breznakibacter xylanolyticus]|uniref:Uncharacterized protein n=1 Tax=Breznakibacter xylanolyticus TaxID=990 RepID=A0A2W7N0X1_9BACT|nr:hypothetical protein LX69_02679 [Breznakibacter xylanolyticus]